ncbi:two pore calcium channel protein 1-like isoform X1 [Quercus lobata]|uniref:two pore calcium channel protein 1-like isoform X1 n=1 Tax=Quercus lobata TaxID=97700 RepID=UPI0012484712|nr:two pore calcium channel protein 1-like isoform X1 [Quercus lobata]XP_030929787.1 two pore calcium channel protein 1-like isoform X1 [Quercus lobata]
MENPLLSGESSRARAAAGRKREHHNRSEAIAYGSNFEKAAALVDLAEDGIGLPEQILDQSNFQTAAKSYFVFIQFDFIWSLNYFAMIILNFLEKPLWCTNYSTDSCNDRDYYFLGQLPYLTGEESLIYEGISLFILVIHTFFPISYEGCCLYWKSLLNRLKVALLLIWVADILVYALYLSPVGFDYLPFRIAPYIRVVFFVLNFRELRATIFILAGILDTYLNVLALGLLFLLFSSWLAYVMFEDTQQGKIVFTSYGTTLYQMFILFTTSNNPDVWIPAYKASRWFCLFFVLYVLLGVYFITNLILAVVYDSFKDQFAKQVSVMDSTRRQILEKAFNLIDKDNHGFLDKEQCIKLFEELNNYRTLPEISREEFELIFDELDDSHDFKINLNEFYYLCNAIALKFPKEERESCFEYFPSVYNSPCSKKLIGFVRSPIFGYIISFILILNLFAVIVETTLDIENDSAQKVWQEVEFVFGWIYVLEMALKIYSFGFENYWRDGQNRFDFMVTWIIVIGETLTFVAPQGLTFLSNGEWIRYLLLTRMLRLIRLLMYIKRYRAYIATFITLIPSLMPYLGTIFCVLCIYCSLGVQIFGGLVNAGNASLDGTDLSDDDYLLFNFNDYPNGMVTLFNLLVMGNWQVWMQSYKELTGTAWSLTYFVSFYLITVLLLLNLIVAFVLEAFFAEMDLESSDNFEEQDKAVEGRKDPRRTIGTKSRSQRVDLLLHHMLSAELDKEPPNP